MFAHLRAQFASIQDSSVPTENSQPGDSEVQTLTEPYADVPEIQVRNFNELKAAKQLSTRHFDVRTRLDLDQGTATSGSQVNQQVFCLSFSIQTLYTVPTRFIFFCHPSKPGMDSNPSCHMQRVAVRRICDIGDVSEKLHLLGASETLSAALWNQMVDGVWEQ